MNATTAEVLTLDVERLVRIDHRIDEHECAGLRDDSGRGVQGGGA